MIHEQRYRQAEEVAEKGEHIYNKLRPALYVRLRRQRGHKSQLFALIDMRDESFRIYTLCDFMRAQRREIRNFPFLYLREVDYGEHFSKFLFALRNSIVPDEEWY